MHIYSVGPYSVVIPVYYTWCGNPTCVLTGRLTEMYLKAHAQRNQNTVNWKAAKICRDSNVITHWSASKTQNDAIKGKFPATASNSSWDM